MASQMEFDLTERILLHLESCEEVDTLHLAQQFGIEHQKIVGAMKSIQAHGELLKAEALTHKSLQLTDEGQSVALHGSHEAIIYAAVPDEGGIAQADLLASGGCNAKLGFSKAMSQGWLWLDKSVQPPLIRRRVANIVDHVQEQLLQLQLAGGEAQLSAPDVTDYKKRKLLQELSIKSFRLSKGPEFATTLTKLETDLTMDMLATGQWQQLKFKAYNFDALGASPMRGQLHPLLKVRTEFRQIFLEMGFSEMATNNYVEASFWNFDALFQPQQHPARDAHDTFFIKQPAQCGELPEDYVRRVQTVHSVGGYGSLGYGYEWQLAEAQKNLLRTHTTAVSARILFQLANRAGGFKPAKYFSIDKVFRNETLDATHLAEFHQVEGVIADVGLTLGDLIGTLHEFFCKLGITRLEFKPAYNPYTEPSMEIFCYHPGLAKWIEVGNSGVFRPELLLPMGLPKDVNVIAWGLSLERPTMIKYGINNIRDLVGPKVDLKMVEDGPICRLDHV
ncbi:phenylalanine--tRNA ligase alpha subunit-like [Drosophila novamexicana]|uniref:phenylalanine--tRNA ligase alpha subunit-like n=1 Tax=Drosophila novamexicana TaxID=47314 RepID=UPI0011E5C76B|nr:phenylalanine--tRNA ligase alpha subunit-like [Drosophila novamexicana]